MAPSSSGRSSSRIIFLGLLALTMEALLSFEMPETAHLRDETTYPRKLQPHQNLCENLEPHSVPASCLNDPPPPAPNIKETDSEFWHMLVGPVVYVCVCVCGPGSSVGIATELRAGRSVIESRWGRDFPPVQTGPGAHPASCKTGIGSFPGVECGRGVLLTTHSF